MQEKNKMPTVLHFINVGQGNMTFIQADNGKRILYDCNVTNENEDRVLRYLGSLIEWSSKIDIFVNSHRDADHMRGIKKVHKYFPIQKIWDSGVTGGTTDSPEYKDYMDLRRRVGFLEVERLKKWTFGKTVLRVMNSKNDDLPDDPNSQSIVIKVQHSDSNGNYISGVMLTGDTDAETWKYSIQNNYSKSDLSSDLLLASHHGSISFFDDEKDSQYYYTNHVSSISPALTIISVGDNPHGHPDEKAIELYEKYSTGSNKGNKIKRTDEDGTMKLILKDDGGWNLKHNQ